MEEKFAISIYVCNKPGVLVRLAQTFARRGYNVDSLVVSPAHNTNFSRITVVVQGVPSSYDQILRQLNKLVDVIKVVDLNEYEHIEKELLLTKLIAKEKEDHEAVKRVVDTFNGRIIDVTKNLYTIEITDTCEKIDAFITTLDDHLILEVVRSGVSAISLGEKAIQS